MKRWAALLLVAGISAAVAVVVTVLILSESGLDGAGLPSGDFVGSAQDEDSGVRGAELPANEFVRSARDVDGEEPEDTVLRSFSYLKEANLEALRSCYTEEAWEVVQIAVPPAANGETSEMLKRQMAQLGEIHVESSTIDGDHARVVVRIDEGTEQREEFLLVKTPNGWRIE